MAAHAESEMSDMYGDLHKACASLDYDKALRFSNKILQNFPEEFKAFHCKMVSLIHLDRHDDCLHQLKKNSEFSSKLLFEKAYCEYRLNRIKEAVTTLEAADQSDLRIQELLVQVLYRLERFDEAFIKYRRIIKESQDDYGDERLTNMASVVAALQTWGNTRVDSLDINEDSYELKYNMACYLVGRGMYDEAIVKLKEAEDMLQESFTEDADITEDEINDELAPIRAQRAYVLHRQGRIEEASQIYQSIVKQRPSDVAVVAVVSNNIVCINREQNVFDSRKKMKAATADGLKHKLMKGQRRSIACNHCLFCLHTNQSETCRTSCLKLTEENPDSDRPALIYVAQLVKDRQIPAAITFLEEYCKGRPDSLTSLLTLCQLHLAQGGVSLACQLLENLPAEVVNRSGVVAARVVLYQSLEDVDSAAACLTQAISWHKTAKSDTEDYTRLVSASAKFHLRHNMPEKAAQLYEELGRLQPGDSKVVAHLIHAYSQFDKTKAEKASKSLKQKDTTFSEGEVDSLESAFLFGAKYMRRMVKGAAESTPRSPKQEDVSQTKRVKKSRKKKGPLPKNLEPNTPIDAERWLPRRERSYYRGRKKDKRGNPMRGPQGQTTGAGDLDQSSRGPGPTATGSDPSSPRGAASAAPPASAGSSRPAGGSRSHQNRNKKKKGGRW